MAIAYRSIMSANPDAKSATYLISEVESWLKSKNCKPGFEGTYFANKTKFSHFQISNEEFSAMRWQIDEIWELGPKYLDAKEKDKHGISTITLVKTAHKTWVWVDVDSPVGSWARPDGQVVSGTVETETPRVVKSIIENCEVFDGIAEVSPTPLIVATNRHLEELLEILEDDRRYSAIFVSLPPLGVSSEDWARQITAITDRSKGIACTYVLDQSLQAKFVELVGFKHSVNPGSMRTYLPGVKVFDFVDAYRHKLLTAAKLQSENFRHLSKMLKSAQINRLATAKLPRVLLEADQALSRAQRFDSRPFEALNSDLAVASLEKKVESGLTTEPKNDKVHEEEAQFWKQIAEEYADENAILKMQFEDSKSTENFIEELYGEIARLSIERKGQEDLIGLLRTELTKLGSQDAFVLEVDEGNATKVPDTTEELIDSINSVPFMEFVGDRETAVRLDDAPNIWPGLVRVWETVLALSAYAQKKVSGEFQGGAKQYMESTLHNGLKVSGIKWRESESVLNNPKLERQRRLKVPTSMEPSGELTFVAHIAFGSKAQNYPRMYFFDALHTDFKKIAIGYIGEHLDNTLSN